MYCLILLMVLYHDGWWWHLWSSERVCDRDKDQWNTRCMLSMEGSCNQLATGFTCKVMAYRPIKQVSSFWEGH